MYRVLIADDEPHMLKFIEFTLRKGNFEILKAKDGLQALEVAEAQKPNVIVLDVLMPGMDGVTALKNLKKKRKEHKGKGTNKINQKSSTIFTSTN